LDFFAGSGTTAQAVMELNAERTENILETIKMDSLSDGSAQRALSPARESNLNKNKAFSAPAKADNSANALRYILVQLDESVKEGSEAEKAGYKTIDEISRERIKRAAEKIGDKSGFKSFFLKTPSADTLDKIDEFIPDENLVGGDMINPFSAKSLGAKGNADGKDVLLSTWLLDDGFTFDEKVEEIKFAEALGYYIGRRLYILDDKWNTESAKALLNSIGKNELLLQTIIVYAYSLNFETLLELKTNLKTNLAEDKKIEIIERF
ncbi:MAG: hypothetical protein LBH29_02435, partial [Elusimicrobiota bacterium]|jgi:adenine-specific DNA-methyltransferase|nr:hypothetical protein [Elusimicrobiota bacterium]